MSDVTAVIVFASFGISIFAIVYFVSWIIGQMGEWQESQRRHRERGVKNDAYADFRVLVCDEVRRASESLAEAVDNGDWQAAATAKAIKERLSAVVDKMLKHEEDGK